MQVRKPDQPPTPSTKAPAPPPANPVGGGQQVSLHDAIGFLTAMEADDAYVGGYLILNPMGRPLEFHCTAPVWPTRAQEILYGPTLLPFLIGEQIGGALLNKAKLNPRLLVTDTEPMLAARMTQPLPLICLAKRDEPSSRPISDARTARGFEGDLESLEATWKSFGDALDLQEPFTRIRDAIGEAQKSRKAS